MKILFVVTSAFPTQKAYGVTTRESMLAAKNLGHKVYSLSLKAITQTPIMMKLLTV